MYTVYADDDHCVSNPCMSNAECRQLSGGYTCSPCPLNVTGPRCEFGRWTNSFYYYTAVADNGLFILLSPTFCPIQIR